MNKTVKISSELIFLLGAELNAISEFIYGSIMLYETYPSLACLSDAIASSELEHYRLLSHIIRSAGVDPSLKLRIRCGGPELFCNAQKTYDTFFAYACAKKELSERYRRLSACEELSAVCRSTFTKLADDELSHSEMILSETDKIKSVLFGNNKV